jgi:hypothetical protein
MPAEIGSAGEFAFLPQITTILNNQYSLLPHFWQTNLAKDNQRLPPEKRPGEMSVPTK